MKYCIGEFAEILGVTVDTLRLYEKYGIISPIKDNINNYRYYDDLDARNLLMSRWYRSMKIPLQDVSTLTKDSSIDTISQRISESKLTLEEEIRRSTLILKKLSEIKDNINSIPSSLNICKTSL